MEAPVFNIAGEEVDRVTLRDDVFGVSPNVPVMHQALLRQQANGHLGTASTKTRGDVSGGGRKPWRQKGTGRARQGSTRSPQWTGGGTVFGPHPRSFVQAMPKKMRRLAVRSALSAKLADGRVVLISSLDDLEPKTKAMLQVFTHLNVVGRVLIALPEQKTNVQLATGNIEGVKSLLAPYLNVADLLKYDYLLMPVASLGVIERTLLGSQAKADAQEAKLHRGWGLGPEGESEET